MSLKPQEDLGVPDETRRVAIAALPKGCACLRIGDVLGCEHQDKEFEALFPRRGQPAEARGRLALATVLQFTEGFSDRRVKPRTNSTHVLTSPHHEPAGAGWRNLARHVE